MKYKTHGHYSYTVNALETYNNECVNCTVLMMMMNSLFDKIIQEKKRKYLYLQAKMKG